MHNEVLNLQRKCVVTVYREASVVGEASKVSLCYITCCMRPVLMRDLTESMQENTETGSCEKKMPAS